MNKTVTSKEAILAVAKEVVLSSGLQNLNIRDVADKCSVSVGSIYNYFPTKGDLILSTIESIWREILVLDASENPSQSFTDKVESLFHRIRDGLGQSPSFFLSHSMNAASLDKEKGRESMNRYLGIIRKDLLHALNEDHRVETQRFTETFSKETFVDFVFSNIITLLLNQSSSCQVLLEVIQRVIY
jgi:AcrR family transcriptional regulator